MYKSRNKHIFKTHNPNLVIGAVRAFPNFDNTIERMVETFNVVALRNDPMLLEITALYQRFEHGQEFVPIHFADTCPKLEKFQKYITTESMFACVAYRYKGYPLDYERGPVILPTYDEYKKYLIYLCESTDDIMWKWFFEQCVRKYIYDNTAWFSESLMTRRFKVMENTTMPILYSKIFDKEYALSFIEDMYTRNIYELIFTEFK